MAKKNDPEYVTTGKRGKGFALQIPVSHPPRCVCKTCLDPKRRPASTLDQPFIIRVQRQSSTPKSRNQSIGEAGALKKQLEAELAEAVEASRKAQIAAHGPTLKAIAKTYAEHLQKEGKRYDRDRYVIDAIVEYFNPDRDPATISKADYLTWCGDLRKNGLADATIHRRTTTLLAILNRARRWDVIPRHQLDGIEKPKPRRGTPVVYTPQQLGALLGPAMDTYETEQRVAQATFLTGTGRRPPSVVPLRGIVMIGLYTLLRPSNNLALTWGDITLDPAKDEGSFRVVKHKNEAKGIIAEGALHPDLVRYLRRIRPQKAKGFIHPNPETKRPFVNIRTQWARLVGIANAMLPEDEQIVGRAEDIYVLRATGASLLAAFGADPTLICQMMGDAQLETIRRHYFKSHIAHMQVAVNRVAIPTFTP
jgi:integrase